MMGRTALFGVLLAAGEARAADAANLPHGAYICTVEQTAGIGAEMMEGSDPPKAFVDDGERSFRIVVTRPKKGAKGRVIETTPRNATSAVLHSAYLGDGWKFAAVQDQAFLRLDFIGEAGWLRFYHAGFEKPDVDHLNLTVREGHCEPGK
jgi:hypothetical protein